MIRQAGFGQMNRLAGPVRFPFGAVARLRLIGASDQPVTGRLTMLLGCPPLNLVVLALVLVEPDLA